MGGIRGVFSLRPLSEIDMKTKIVCRLFCLSFLLIVAGNSISGPIIAADAESLTLARIDLQDDASEITLPIYAHLMGADGVQYVLVMAPLLQIQSSGYSFRILDSAQESRAYIVATRSPQPSASGMSNAKTSDLQVLVDDGRQIVARASEPEAIALAEAGYEIARFPETPIVWRKGTGAAAGEIQAMKQPLEPTHEIQRMINDVTQATLADYVGKLSGESAATIGGSSYTITTRHTASGTPITKATQYAYEFMQNLGLAVSYHSWSAVSFSGRNVVGTMAGKSIPNEIVLITAHLDDMPSSGSAPGADDNASGSAALMLAAEVMSRHLFQRTIRFVFFTGEEQGLYGSAAYANAAFSAGDNIVAVLNLDMISWDAAGAPVARLHTRTKGNASGYAADKVIADTFIDVASAYGLSSSISPLIDADGITYSDHSSFWNRGYAAILAIEDDESDFCAYYHTANDRRSYSNMAYYANYVKAIIGTAAHLAITRRVATPDFDYDEDGKSDISVWRPESGTWYSLSSSTPDNWTGTQWGLLTDAIVPADYDGDARSDRAVYRSENGTWYIQPSASPGSYTSTQWGSAGDKAMPGDYDGDGKADVAVWRPDTGTWYVLLSGTPGQFTGTQWGLPDDAPVPGDYDHDGKADIAVWRPGTGTWYVLLSNTPGAYTATQWGKATDIPSTGDYDGDGKTDIAVWRPASGMWFILSSISPGTYRGTQWGVSSDIPVPGDYDGDGKTDIAVYRPGDGTWYVLPSGSPGTYTSTRWGTAADTPVSALKAIIQAVP
jgi:hypothetical protein